MKPKISIALCASYALISCVPGSKKEPKPNVIFILLDDYGYTDLGCYGSKFYETPNIDRLASEGIRFTDAYAACPVSSPTRAALMTGKYPVNTGVTDWIPGRQAYGANGLPEDRFIAQPFNLKLDLNETTIAEAMKSNGYATMISGKWHLGEDSIYWPEQQGFDVNKGGYSRGAPNKNNKSNGYFSPYGNPRLEDGPVGEYLTDRQTDDVMKFITDQENAPFFVYLSYYAVHNPMQGKEELIEYFQAKADSMGLSEIQPFTKEKEWIKLAPGGDFKERTIQSYAVYAAMIYSVDENLGRLFEKLRELKIDNNTVIIFTSDNGGLSTAEGSPTTNYPLRAGKGWLYEGGIREPLIIKAPGFINGSAISDVPVSTIDFFPTILELTGTSLSNIKTDGISILPLLKSGEIMIRPLFWHYPHYSNQGGDPGSAVRLGNFKLIDNFETGRQELYDLKTDISESIDISETNPEKAKELYDLLTEWRDKSGAKMMDPNPLWNGLE
ncbi:MAG TPA: sulfatase [Bacteroidales bacterium]|nr:sulfatase [Bacteroidales bacterium]